MATHSFSCLENSETKKPGGLQSTGSQRVGHEERAVTGTPGGGKWSDYRFASGLSMRSKRRERN